jgi:hypothetical protein
LSSYYITDAVTATPRVTAIAAASTAVPAATAALGVAAIATVATPVPAVVAQARIAAVSVGVRDLGGGGTGGGCCEGEVFKVLFNNAGDVALLGDGSIATGRI